MPAIQLQTVDMAAAYWQGRCPATGCGGSFAIEADPWQGRISVLTQLTGFPRDDVSHLHGSFVMFDDLERGGE